MKNKIIYYLLILLEKRERKLLEKLGADLRNAKSENEARQIHCKWLKGSRRRYKIGNILLLEKILLLEGKQK